ncbi:hypothetical protein CBL_01987 [Carabus blaptoides fortunei]
MPWDDVEMRRAFNGCVQHNCILLHKSSKGKAKQRFYYPSCTKPADDNVIDFELNVKSVYPWRVVCTSGFQLTRRLYTSTIDDLHNQHREARDSRKEPATNLWHCSTNRQKHKPRERVRNIFWRVEKFYIPVEMNEESRTHKLGRRMLHDHYLNALQTKLAVEQWRRLASVRRCKMRLVAFHDDESV